MPCRGVHVSMLSPRRQMCVIARNSGWSVRTCVVARATGTPRAASFSQSISRRRPPSGAKRPSSASQRRSSSLRPGTSVAGASIKSIVLHPASAPKASEVPSASQFWIGEDHLAQGSVIADIAGAAADMAVHRLEYARLHLCPRRRSSDEALDEHLRLVDETRRAVAALEGKMVKKRGLHSRKLALP